MNFFGLEIWDGWIYLGFFFYIFMIWLVWNILRRKYPVRVLKLGTGQTATFHRASEDDLKVHWKEGWRERIAHEALKLAHCRIIPFWGIFNKVYLVRRDWNILIPFARKTEKKKLCPKCASQFKTKEAITNFEKYDSKPLKDVVCDKCKEKIPEYIIVDFTEGDVLKGSSTEALVQRENEDFTREASDAMRKRKKADILTYVLLGGFMGSMVTMVIFIATNVITLG